MSIAKSPFSKQLPSTSKPTGVGVDEFGNETWTDEKGNVTITKYNTTFTPVTYPSATGTKKSDDNEISQSDILKTMRELRTKGKAIDKKVMNDPRLSEAEKREWAENVLRTQMGKNVSGKIQKGIDFAVVNPLKMIGKPLLKAYDYAVDPWISAGNALLTEGGKFISEAQQGEGIDFDRFKENVLTKRYRAFGPEGDLTSGYENLDKALTFGTEVLFDPLTYVTMGSSVSSKAGRLALANRMVPLVDKYPELSSMLGNIARYGPTEIPKYIREAEGIFSGVKWFGQELAFTEGLAKGWRYSGGALRANIGDVVLGSKTGQILEAVTTSKTMRGAVETGIFRRGAMNVENPDFLVALGEKSANVQSKGHYERMNRLAIAEADEHVEIYELLRTNGDPTFGSIVHAVESPVLIGSLSPAAREAAYKFKDWSEAIYSRLQEATRELARTRGLDINELSYLDDHIYHQLTPTAKEDIFGKKGSLKSKFDLTTNDVIESAGPLQFRKYKKGEPFLDKPALEHGTISEINQVYGDYLVKNGKPRANFFEDDLRVISEGYAASVARAHARLRFVDTMFNYGPDVIKPLMVKEVIPDAKLLSALRTELDTLSKLRNALSKTVAMRKRVGPDTTKIKTGVAKELRNTIGLVTEALDGSYLAKMENSEEAIRIAAELEQLILRLEEGRNAAMSLSVQERGYWADAHVGLLTEAHRLREAIVSGYGDRYIARQKLVQMYNAEFPDSDGSELIDKPLEWIAERISRSLNNGQSISNHELSVLKYSLDGVVADIDALPKTSENIQKLQWLDERRTKILAQMNGHEELDFVREAASYSDSGMLFGAAPIEGEPIPFQAWNTKVPDGEVDFYRQMPDSIMRHAIPEEELIDFRTVEHMGALVDDPSTLYEFGYSWGRLGKPDLTWNTVVDDAFETGQVDDLLWDVSPEKAMLIDGFLQFREILEEADRLGVDLTDSQVTSFFNMIKDANYNVIAASAGDNADAVTRQVVNDFMESLINTAEQEGFRGVLVPAKSLMDDAGAGDWSVLVHKSAPTPEVGTEFIDEVQFVMDNPFADSILDNTTEMSRLNLMSNADTLALDGLDIEIVQASRRELEDQLFRGEKLIEVNKIVSDIDEDMVTVDGERIPAFLAKSKLAKIEDQVTAAYDEINDGVWATAEELYGLSGIEGRIKDLNVQRMINFDNAEMLKRWTPEFEEALVNEVAAMVLHLRNIPDQGISVGANAAWVRTAETMMGNITAIQDPAVSEAYGRVVKLLLADEVALSKLDQEIYDKSMELYLTEMGDRGGRFVYDIADKGWKELNALGVQMPKDVLERWMPNLKKLEDVDEWKTFVKALSRQQGYWKKYVTNTMGFLVRNGYSGSFMNYADGVSANHMLEGAKWAGKQGPVIRNEANWKKSGKSYASWMEEAGIDITNPAAVDEANKVMEIVYATSRGVNTDNAMPVVDRWKVTKFLDKNKQTAKWRLGDNPYLNLFTTKNDYVERALRIPMALDSVRQGHTFEEAVARISRVHFDYGDLSRLDEAAKSVIPFWIWASRNVPLQVTQIMTRPKAYYQYEKLQNNFGVTVDDPNTPEDEGIIVPKWVNDYRPLQVGLGSVLRPDLPHQRMRNQIEGLFGLKAAGNLTPMLRVPIEVFYAKRQLGIDVGPFKKKAEVRGYEKYVAQLLKTLKQYELIDRDEKTGDWLMHGGVSYVIEQALVPLQQINRLSGGFTGGKANLNERWLSSVLNWFGIPYQGIGPEQENAELVRRSFELEKLKEEIAKKQRIEKDYSSKP